MRKKIVNDYSIFRPDSARRIMLDYKEIAENQTFRLLKPEDLIFVWYYACEASPYYDIKSDRERVEKCIDAAYKRKGGGYLINKQTVNNLLDGKFPLKIQDAISEMLKFRVGPRVRALQILEKGFSKIEAILDVDANDDQQFLNKDGSVDFSKKKAYVDTFRAAMDSMPKLIEQMEQRFSVVEVKDNDSIEHEGKGFIDELIDSEK